MAHLHRWTTDGVLPEELPEHRKDAIGRQLTDYLHTILFEPEEEAHDEVEKYIECHVHDTAEGERCPYCMNHARDYKNGDTVLNA